MSSRNARIHSAILPELKRWRCLSDVPNVNDFSGETWMLLAFAASCGIVGILYTAAAVIRDESRLRATLAKADRLRHQWTKGRHGDDFDVEIVGQGPIEPETPAKQAA